MKNENMKRLVLMGLMGLMVLVGKEVSGQMVTLTKGNEGKTMDDEDVKSARFLGNDGDRFCWLMKEDDRDNDWSVFALDRDLNVRGHLSLPVDKEYKVVALIKNGPLANVVMVDSSRAKRTTVVQFSIDMDSLSLVDNKIDTVKNFEMAKGDCCIVWGATSEDGEFLGLLTVYQMTSKKQYSAVAMMYDREMNELWTREFPLGTTECVAVSNEGELVTLGHEREGASEHFDVAVLNARSGDSYRMTVNSERVNDMQIVNVQNRKVYCAGVFSPKESDPEDNLVGGTAMLVFDLDSTCVTGFTLCPFQNEDVNILLNKKTKKVQKEKIVPMVTVLAGAGTADGCVLAVGHRHTLHYMNANGSVTTSYYAQGLQLVAVNEKAEVKWVRNLRRNDMVYGSDELLYVSLFTEGDSVFLMKMESPKYPTEYDIAKEAKEYELGDKGNLVLYSVTEEGEVHKTILEQKTKHMLISSARSDDGNILMLTLNGRKSRMVEMSF